jgi:uncharacterized membrane protein
MEVALRATPAFLLALTLALGTLLRRRHGQETAISRVGGRLILVLFANGLCTLVIGNPPLFAALRVGGILVATPISGTNVLWGAVFAALLLHELLNLRMA